MEKVQKAYYMLPAMRYSRMQELAMMEALEEHAAEPSSRSQHSCKIFPAKNERVQLLRYYSKTKTLTQSPTT